MRFDNPIELKQASSRAYTSYMDQLYKLWLSAKHPDVDARGRPRSRSLTDDERAALMIERIGPIAARVPKESWHKDCYSPRSSQALFVEVAGMLEKAGALDLLVGESVSSNLGLTFEEIRGRTNFDGILRNQSLVVATSESKFTEEGFGCCDYPRRGLCDGTWFAREKTHRGCPMAEPAPNRSTGDRYWNTAIDIFELTKEPPETSMCCPLWAGYQPVHNLAETRALHAAAVWILLYDERNPYFGDPALGWTEKLRTVKAHIRQISWQCLIAQALKRGCQLEHLRDLHGF